MQDARHAALEAERNAVERQRRASDPHSEGMGSEQPIRRFDEAWALIAATFEAEVTVLANVIAIKPLRAPKKPRAKASR